MSIMQMSELLRNLPLEWDCSKDSDCAKSTRKVSLFMINLDRHLGVISGALRSGWRSRSEVQGLSD